MYILRKYFHSSPLSLLKISNKVEKLSITSTNTNQNFLDLQKFQMFCCLSWKDFIYNILWDHMLSFKINLWHFQMKNKYNLKSKRSMTVINLFLKSQIVQHFEYTIISSICIKKLIINIKCMCLSHFYHLLSLLQPYLLLSQFFVTCNLQKDFITIALQ